MYDPTVQFEFWFSEKTHHEHSTGGKICPLSGDRQSVDCPGEPD
ncbi:hypothetical protein ACR0RJ_00835 [Escherichia coli]